MVELDPLGRAELRRILTEPPDALVREFRELLGLDGVALELADDALDALADHAITRGYGARGLRGVFEEVLRDVLFDAPSHRGTTITLSAAIVRAHLTASESPAV
jgi:ATP-dependent Clp protease ATP-binding subunit ClpX